MRVLKRKKNEMKERKKNGRCSRPRASNDETTFDCDEISKSDSLQRGEHLCGVEFSIQKLDSTIQVGVCFPKKISLNFFGAFCFAFIYFQKPS